MMRGLSPFLLTGGCASGFDLGPQRADEMNVDYSPIDGGLVVPLQVHVIPSRLKEAADVDAFRALPQTFYARTTRSDSPIALGNVVLFTPVIQSGSVDAYQVNPSVADVPGQDVAVAGTVRLHMPGSLQSYVARTDAQGTFDLWAVPGGDYRIEVIPDDPLLPMHTAPFAVSQPTGDAAFDLGAGLPIYGRVWTATGPLSGAEVYVMDAFGARSTRAVADAFGVYQVRVTEGVWSVVCAGRGSGRDASLTVTGVDVSDAGAHLDFTYPTDLGFSLVEGEVRADGAPLIGATVRIFAIDLSGYDDLDAAWSTEVFVDGNGTFLSQVVPGTYDIEVIPPDNAVGRALSPKRIENVSLGEGLTTVDAIRLDPFVPVAGEVRDLAGNAMASSRVVCQEQGFDGRAWEAYTGDRGRFSLDLPNVPVDCEAQPGPDRSDLAIQWRTIDPSLQDTVRFDLVAGSPVTGTVVAESGQPEAYTVVEIRDGDGRVLGSGFTQTDGKFSIPVELSVQNLE